MKDKKNPFFSFLFKLFRKKKVDTSGEKMWSGELVVIGHDEVKIRLGEKHPENVSVSFVGEQKSDCIPCNPHHHDKCHWRIMHDVQNHNKDYHLIITWHVSDLRVIQWSAE